MAVPTMTNGNYLQDNLTGFFNMLIRNCHTITGDESLLDDIFDRIVSLQYDSINKTVLIETKDHNYTLVEVGANLRLCEFKKKVVLK